MSQYVRISVRCMVRLSIYACHIAYGSIQSVCVFVCKFIYFTRESDKISKWEFIILKRRGNMCMYVASNSLLFQLLAFCWQFCVILFFHCMFLCCSYNRIFVFFFSMSFVSPHIEHIESFLSIKK